MLPLDVNEGSEFCTECHFGLASGIKYIGTISNMCVCVFMYMFIYKFINMYMFIYKFINIYIYICMYVCIYVCIYI